MHERVSDEVSVALAGLELAMILLHLKHIYYRHMPPCWPKLKRKQNLTPINSKEHYFLYICSGTTCVQLLAQPLKLWTTMPERCGNLQRRLAKNKLGIQRRNVLRTERVCTGTFSFLLARM